MIARFAAHKPAHARALAAGGKPAVTTSAPIPVPSAARREILNSVMVLFTSAVHCAVSAERNGITSPNAEVSSIDAVMSTVQVGPRPAEDAGGAQDTTP